MEFSLPDIIFGRRWKAAAEWLPEGFRLRRIYTETLMMMKITLVAVILIILLLPLIFDKKTKLDRSKPGLGNARMPAAPRYKPPRYNGPKTDERINRMFAECQTLLRELGVPISNSISPTVMLNGRRRAFGICYWKGSGRKRNKFDFYIELSGYALNNTEKSLRSTLIHELIHTVPGGQCHTGEWKKWAKFVSEKTGYTISRCEGDETEEDRLNILNGGYAKGFEPYAPNPKK